jgi:hypothetical protein
VLHHQALDDYFIPTRVKRQGPKTGQRGRPKKASSIFALDRHDAVLQSWALGAAWTVARQARPAGWAWTEWLAEAQLEALEIHDRACQLASRPMDAQQAANYIYRQVRRWLPKRLAHWFRLQPIELPLPEFIRYQRTPLPDRRMMPPEIEWQDSERFAIAV